MSPDSESNRTPLYSFLDKLPPELKGEEVKSLKNWSDLESLGDEPYALLLVGNEIPPHKLKENMEDSQAQKWGLVYLGRSLSVDEIVQLNHIPQVLKIIDLAIPNNDLKKLLQEAEAILQQKKNLTDILERVRAQNKTLQELNENLGVIVEQRTSHLEASKKEIEKKLKDVRDLIRFIKSLSTINAMEDILLILKQEFIRFHRLRPPLMIYSLAPGLHRCLYFQGPQIIDRTIQLPLTEISHKDASRLREILADTLERPFGSILCVFMNHPDQHGVLVFEHSMENWEQQVFLSVLDRRVESLTVAFDRIALKMRAQEISKQWSNTFDFLQDPVAIVDREGNLIRSNKTFNSLSQKDLGKIFKTDLNFSQPMKRTISMDKKIFEVSLYPIFLDQGERSYNSIVHFADVTQATQLHSQLIQNEKMSAIGLLAGNIAHELNNPLTGIKSLAQLLIAELSAESPVSQDLKEVAGAAERCELIIKNLLEFSSFHGGQNLQAVSVRGVILKTLTFLKSAMRYQNSSIELSEEDDRALVEPHLLQQVIFNLVNNACQAMGEEGDLFMESEVQADRILVRVRDTGPGISEEHRQNIFTPFFTTKEEGKGTGLGLSMSRAIVEKFGGQLNLNENISQGSEFVIELPRYKGPL